MPRSEEIAHYAELLASLTVTAARAGERAEDLRAIHAELAEAYADVFTLLSHDAFELHRRPELAERLLNAAEARGRSEVARS